MPVEAYIKLIDRLSEPHLLVSGEGIVLGANRRFVRLGLEPRGLRGRPLSDITTQPPEVISAYLRRCSKSSDPFLGSLTLRRSDGGELACRSDGSVVDPPSDAAGAVILLRLVPKDVSVGQFLTLNQKIDQLGRQILYRKRAEEELREQKEWLSVMLTSIGDAVIATDNEGRIIFMNSVAELLTGWQQAEASSQPLEEVFRIINEETRETVESSVTRCLREGGVVGLAHHTLLIDRDGTEYAIDDTAAPIREPGGRVRGVVLVFQDVGDRRSLERELHARAERLAENDRRKDEFLAMLAHELRNPLAAVGNAVTVLKMSNDPENIDFAKDIIERQTRQLTRLIDDLLDVSRISSGKIRLKRDLCDAGTILKQAIESVRPLIDKRKHRLTTDFEEGALPLRADATRIEQIAVNLLNNAAKYTDSGGQIRLTGKRDGEHVVITVEDNGMGILPEKLPEMFGLFAQGERSIARSEGGLGIGLTIVQKLAEMHGGRVSARSEGPGKGSTFTVTLPAARPPASASRRSETRPPERRGYRILVVDDNVDTARGMARFLKLLGNEVQTVHDGPSAIEAARTLRPEFVLLDIGLPGMDGYEVALMLREEPGCKAAVIIAVSGYGREEDRRRSREAGFDHHLVKPVDFDRLISLMTQV